MNLGVEIVKDVFHDRTVQNHLSVVKPFCKINSGMKTFRQILENIRPPIDSTNFLYQFKGKTVCEILSNRNPPRKGTSILMDYNDVRELRFGIEGVKKEVNDFYDLLTTWIGGMKSMDRVVHQKLTDQLIQYFQNCPNRAGWSKYTGKVYRGLKVPVTVSNLKITNNIFNIHDPRYSSDSFYAVGTYTYKSNLPAQSWSKNMFTAAAFAGTRVGRETDIGMILEHPITPNESISLKYLGNPQESEVIRIGNSPINVKCYVLIGSTNPARNAELRDGPVKAMVDRGILSKMPL